jgi:hypothetical protein
VTIACQTMHAWCQYPWLLLQILYSLALGVICTLLDDPLIALYAQKGLIARVVTKLLIAALAIIVTPVSFSHVMNSFWNMPFAAGSSSVQTMLLHKIHDIYCQVYYQSFGYNLFDPMYCTTNHEPGPPTVCT